MRGWVCDVCTSGADVVMTARADAERPSCSHCGRPLRRITGVALVRDLRRVHEHDERENLPPDGDSRPL